jgi:Protein of unknown function (DUF3592)
MMPSSPTPDEPVTRAGRVGGAIVASCFGAVFVIGGLFVAGLIVRTWWAQARVYGWSEGTATIVEARASAPPRHDQDPVLTVRFRYDYAGRSYESDRFAAQSSARDADAYRMATLWQPGSTWPCCIDPRHPQVAVLRRDSLWWGLAVFLPLGVAGGIGGLLLYAAWASLRSSARDPKAAAPPPQTAAATPARRAGERVGITLFIGALLVMIYLFSARPLLLYASAAHWREQPCTVVASRARRSHSDGRTGYSVEIVFRYQAGGRAQASGDYNLVANGALSYADAAEIVRRYPPGAQATCYVNPRDPAQAVLDRSLPDATPFGLIPLAFLIAVIWGLVVVRRRA